MASLTSKIKNSLQEKISERFEISCYAEHEEYAKGKHKILFDNYFVLNDTLYIVELEIFRNDPATNVIKTVFWNNYLRGKRKQVILIQIFNSKSVENRNVEFCRFLGKRAHHMGKNLKSFDYHAEVIDIDEHKIKRDKNYFNMIINAFLLKVAKHVR